MRISVAADELTGIAQPLVAELRQRGHEPILHCAYVEDERPDWAWASEAAARDVAEGRADQAIVACWTGTGGGAVSGVGYFGVNTGGSPFQAQRWVRAASSAAERSLCSVEKPHFGAVQAAACLVWPRPLLKVATWTGPMRTTS